MRIHQLRQAPAVMVLITLVAATLIGGLSTGNASGQSAISVSTVTVYGPDDGSFGTSLQASLSTVAPGSSTIVVSPSDPAALHTALTNASAPNRLVITHGAGFGPALSIVAPAFPATAYLWIEANEDLYLSNVTSLFVDTGDGARVLGRIAGLLDDSDQVGFVADGASGVQHVYIEQFMAGIAMTNSDMTVGKRFAAAGDSPGRGHTLAAELNEAGATSLSAVGRGTRAAAVLAQDKGTDWYGVGIDYAGTNPDITIASLVFDFGPSVASVLGRLDEGELGGPPMFASMRSGASRVALNPARPLDDVTLGLINEIVETTTGSPLVQGAAAQAAATATPTAAPTATPAPSATPDPAATATPTPDPAATAIPTAAATPTPTPDPNVTTTPEPSPTAVADPTATPEPTQAATPEPTPTPGVVSALAFTGTESKGLAEAGTALLLAGLVLASISVLITRLSRTD